jgi:hypothetical protein
MRRIKRKCVQIGEIEPKSSATFGAAEKDLRGENVIARVPAASSGYKHPLSCPRGGRRATNCGARRAAGLKIIAACTRRARETRCSLFGHQKRQKTTLIPPFNFGRDREHNVRVNIRGPKKCKDA